MRTDMGSNGHEHHSRSASPQKVCAQRPPRAYWPWPGALLLNLSALLLLPRMGTSQRIEGMGRREMASI